MWPLAFFCFPPGISGPLAPGNCVSPLSARARDSAKCRRPSWARMAQNPRISRFPAPGGPVGQKVKRKKVADNHPGSRGNFFVNLGPLSTGNCDFTFLAWARDFSKRQGPSWAKMAETPRISRFPARGGPVSQSVNSKKGAGNHPGRRGNSFFPFGDP